MTKQTAIPCVLMRGGTSKGPYILKKDLPEDIETRDNVLLALMGSPDIRQTDGVGGATPLTSKLAMLSPSEREGIDIDYHFAQVSIDKAYVDTAPSCGNILAGVGPFAIDQGIVPVAGETTTVRIFNINTESVIEAEIRTDGGYVNYDGDAAIDGVPGTAAPVLLKFMDIAGSKTSGLLPTGSPIDVIDGIDCTCIDVAMPMVIMRAEDLGVTGHESAEELDKNTALYERMEAIRLKAGKLMGLGDVTDSVIPKLGLVAAPKKGGNIAARYFVPHKAHTAYAVTGGICTATCAVMRGSVADGLSKVERTEEEEIVIEHPSGAMTVHLGVDGHSANMNVRYGGTLRTARRLMSGDVFVPGDVWDGDASAA